MSGRELCVNPQCTDFGFQHEGMCRLPTPERENMAKITASTKMTVSSPSRIPVPDLKNFLQNVPDEAKISITNYSGDQREPGYAVIEATWEL